ncbi:hypothetical protein [Clostridium sp. FP1]|uniref:hypothetical protein n=1 Tax=Clostridium sp. FP1 TaxID=2724076 RepID=UPI0013E919C0|nr:hypothetical protein [Clostridium sp. FP1]MBZ9635529.1 hypothetical protein [Clostridium sp. FP1]
MCNKNLTTKTGANGVQNIFNFGLCGGTYGVGSENEILELCKDFSTTVYSVDLASIRDVEEWTGQTEEHWTGLICVQEGTYEWLDMLEIEQAIAEECGEELSTTERLSCFIGYRKIS